MNVQKEKAKAQANNLRFDRESQKGHYESYFLRANHPTKKEAFWIRYTIFSPKGDPGKSIGELWAIYFSPEGHFASKKEVSTTKCQLNNTHFDARIDDSTIRSNKAVGNIDNFKWDLDYESNENPIFLLPLNYYSIPFPKAKAIVPQPFAKFNGSLEVQGKKIKIKDWIGSQNHNWGEKHTDYYAWGQVAGFDNHPDSFLELITGQLKIGPLTTPFLTMIVLRHKGKEYQLNTMANAIKSKGAFDFFTWQFSSENSEVKISGSIEGVKEDFVGLNYYNPPGGSKDCLNSKVASCKIEIEEKSKIGIHDKLECKDRTAFEILTDRKDHGIHVNF